MQIVVAGTLTHYQLVNPKAKTPVILLLGWAQDSSHWLPLARLLSPQYRYYLLDLPGFGGTQNLKANADIPDYTQFIHSFRAKLKLKDVILVGHSFGGQVAADFALKHPRDLHRLILIDSATIRVRTLSTKLKIILTKALKPITRLLSLKTVKRILSLYAPPEYVNANHYQKGVLDHILKYDLSPRLHLIKVPTEIIWGSEDRVIPYVGKQLVETIPNANLHIIYGAGHQSHITHPGPLASTINRLLHD